MTTPTTPATKTPGISGLEREAPGLVSGREPRKESTGSKGSRRPRRRTLIAVAAGLLGILLVTVALTTGTSAGGALDPRSAAPGGTRALATLLRDQGVKVERGSAAGAGRTVLVPFPEALTEGDLSDLLSSGADVVLIDPGDVSPAQVTATFGLSVRTRPAGCDLPAATVAGDARLGGSRYVTANAAASCYGGALLDLPAGTVPGGGRLTVLGSSDFLTNERLDQQGNAALAIGLLSRQPALTWYSERRATSGSSLGELLPKSIPWAILQIVIAIALIGVWRGRRLGPIVAEPLPVVVRAAETVLGRARLYAAARARGTAAEALRTGSRDRLAALTHLEASGRSTPEALISSVAQRTGTDPADIAALLYDGGGFRAADSDDALVKLANELDRLEDLIKEEDSPMTSPQEDARAPLLALRGEVAKAVIGQDAAVSGLVVALLCEGHVLLEGVPGVAKTLLVRTLSRALQLDSKRVQFTPDLMPSDITGSLVFDARSAGFDFRPGPVFTNVLLADEINRTPPRTQAALLEAMEERQVTVEGEARPLPAPFMVVATQNPIEYEGTYPLPEAQLDRFMLKLTLPLPPREDELRVLTLHDSGFDPRSLAAAGVQAVAGPAQLMSARAGVAAVTVRPEMIAYIVDIARATRVAPALSLGVSPRGATALLAAAKAWAWLSGRNYCTPDDVKALARPALRHRVALRPEAELEGVNADSVLDSVLATVPVPR